MNNNIQVVFHTYWVLTHECVHMQKNIADKMLDKYMTTHLYSLHSLESKLIHSQIF